MTTKAAFTPEEWQVVLEGPPSAGMIVITAAHGGSFRETIAMSKAYVDARAQHGASELLDEVDGYRQFVLTLANKVAAAHREGGQDVSPAETEAIQQIAAALGTAGP